VIEGNHLEAPSPLAPLENETVLVPRHGIAPWLMCDLMSHLESALEARQAFWAPAVALGLAIWNPVRTTCPAGAIARPMVDLIRPVATASAGTPH